MTIWQRIAREPNALTGVAIALYGVLVAFGVLDLDATQTGALAALGGALVFALRWLVTPAGEVVAQRKPGEPTVTGSGAATKAGVPVEVTVGPHVPEGYDPQHRRDESGAVTNLVVLLLAVLGVLALLVLFGIIG